MRTETNIKDFNFIFIGYGRHTVTYTSPKTGRIWAKLITDIMLIDRTKHTNKPKRKDLEELKRLIKRP